MQQRSAWAETVAATLTADGCCEQEPRLVGWAEGRQVEKVSMAHAGVKAAGPNAGPPFGLTVGRDCVVTAVRAGSASQAAGVEAGDVLRCIGGTAVHSKAQAQALLADAAEQQQPGNVDLDVVRREEQPRREQAAAVPEAESPPSSRAVRSPPAVVEALVGLQQHGAHPWSMPVLDVLPLT